jgi:hypothetical protein
MGMRVITHFLMFKKYGLILGDRLIFLARAYPGPSPSCPPEFLDSHVGSWLALTIRAAFIASV